MRFGHPERPHFVQHDARTRIGGLPGGFGAGEAGAHDMHDIGSCVRGCHGVTGSAFSAEVECAESQKRQRPLEAGAIRSLLGLTEDQPL
jgi:hypothetical protein